jgi:hypothetical protein
MYKINRTNKQNTLTNKGPILKVSTKYKKLTECSIQHTLASYIYCRNTGLGGMTQKNLSEQQSRKRHDVNFILYFLTCLISEPTCNVGSGRSA